jgi:hypothetical protein
MAVTTGFSYAPKMQNELASLAPITFGSGLKFSSESPIAFRDQNLSAPSEGYYSGKQALVEGVTKGILSALEGVTGAYVGKRQKEIDKADAEEKATTEHTRALELANLRLPTEEEEKLEKAYKQAQIANLNKQVNDRIQEAMPMDVLPSGARNMLPPIMDLRARDLPPSMTEPSKPDATPAPSAQLPPPVPKPTPLPPTPSPALPPPVPSPVPPPAKSGASLAPQATQSLAELSPLAPQPKAPPALTSALPESAGQMQLQGQTLELMPITGAEGEEQQQPVLKQVPPPDIYDTISVYTSTPYMDYADVAWAQNELNSKLGLKTKVRTVVDEATKMPYYKLDVLSPELQEMSLEGAKVSETGNVSYEYKAAPTPESLIPRLKGQKEKYEILTSTIDKILALMNEPSLPSVGKMSDYISMLPIDTNANDIRQLLQTVKGQIAFGELMAMKEASKTGASGLGALTERELGLLESLQGALSPSMRVEQFKNNLEKLKETTDLTKKRLTEEIALNYAELEGQPQKMRPIGNQENIVRISTKEEYDKLKKGQPFYWQDNPQIGYKQ